jgi:leader peptidase (prepilin peptidase)/N-methyltransferase
MTFAVWFLILGLVIGSFLNVCIYRIPNHKSIVAPPSSCGNCHTHLRPIDLIPVISYLILKGKCRYCHARIAFRYPLVELTNGFLYMIVYDKYGVSIETIFACVFVSFLIVVSFIDLDHMIIPDQVVVFGIIMGGILSLYHFKEAYTIYMGTSLYNGIIGMFSGTAIVLLIALVSMLIYGEDGGLGMGDVKFFIPIGLFLGWQLTLLTLWLSFIYGGIVGIVLLFVFKKDRKMAMPFGPFIALGALTSLFWGKTIITMWLYRT